MWIKGGWIFGGLAVLFIVIKANMWSPFLPLVQLDRWQALIKFVVTVVVEPPFLLSNGDIALKELNDRLYIIEDAQSPGLTELLQRAPPPSVTLDRHKPWRKRVETLRSFVYGLLPGDSALPQHPEPVRALTLLGFNPLQKRYPKLCSKDAKIYVQYLTALGFDSRMIQLHNHVTVEVWNSKNLKWEMHDPYFDSAVMDGRRYLSAREAIEKTRDGEVVDYRGPISVFKELKYIIPRTNFSQGKLFRFHYFNYENLDYWLRCPYDNLCLTNSSS